jgi:hypothetical protein
MLRISSGLVSSCFHDQLIMHISPAPSHPIVIDFMILMIFDEENKLYSSPFCYFLHLLSLSPSLGTLFSNASVPS